MRTATLNSDSTELRELVLEVNSTLTDDGSLSIERFGVGSCDSTKNKNTEDLKNDQLDSKKRNWFGRLWKSIKNVFTKKN